MAWCRSLVPDLSLYERQGPLEFNTMPGCSRDCTGRITPPLTASNGKRLANLSRRIQSHAQATITYVHDLREQSRQRQYSPICNGMLSN